jgi:Flp pilus assembly protein TadG
VRTRRDGERGAAAVEFALVVPILLILVFGIIDFGLAMTQQSLISNAAREGARAGSLEASQKATEDAALGAMTGLMGTKPAVVPDLDSVSAGLQATCTLAAGGACPGWDAGGGGTTKAPSGATVVVKIKYSYRWITPIQIVKVLPGQLTFTRQSVMVVE